MNVHAISAKPFLLHVQLLHCLTLIQVNSGLNGMQDSQVCAEDSQNRMQIYLAATYSRCSVLVVITYFLVPTAPAIKETWFWGSRQKNPIKQFDNQKYISVHYFPFGFHKFHGKQRMTRKANPKPSWNGVSFCSQPCMSSWNQVGFQSNRTADLNSVTAWLSSIIAQLNCTTEVEDKKLNRRSNWL